MSMFDFYINEAESCFNAGDYHKSLSFALEALGIDRVNTTANLLVGVSYHCTGNHSKAVAHLEKCLAEVRSRENIWGLYAKSLFLIQADEQGGKEYEKALKKYPNSVQLLHEYGFFLCKAGRFKKAINRLEKALALDEGRDDLMQILGTCYFNLKKYEKAESLLESALELNPENHFAAHVLGHIYFNIGNHEKAIGCYSRVLFYDASNTKALYDRLLSRVCFKDSEGNIHNPEAAQKDANQLLPHIDDFIKLTSKEGKPLTIVEIKINTTGGIEFRVTQ